MGAVLNASGTSCLYRAYLLVVETSNKYINLCKRLSTDESNDETLGTVAIEGVEFVNEI